MGGVKAVKVGIGDAARCGVLIAILDIFGILLGCSSTRRDALVESLRSKDAGLVSQDALVQGCAAKERN